MYTVELYARVRRAVLVEGRSRRWVAREFGLARKTVGKMLAYSLPPGYRQLQPVRRPKLGPWQGVIDAILEDDKLRPRKQRHTAKRIFERLRAEHGFSGGYTIVKDYVRGSKLGGQEMFVPLTHAPGEAQADFGEALVVIAGVERKAHFLVFDLPHSDDCFVCAFPAETTEAFLEGHVRAFAYFGAVPTRILYDNTTLAVARILGDGERKKTRAFSELQSHDLFAEKFGRPAKGNDKGKVENLVGTARRNFMVPIPHAASWEALNEPLVADCRARRAQRLRGHGETIGERFERDRAAMLPLPASRFEACEKATVRVSSLSLVRYHSNDYSVPTCYGHRQVLVKGYVDRVVICSGSEGIATHQRSYEREQAIYDPLHYLALLEHKARALDQAAPLAGWPLPGCFQTLRRLLEARLKRLAGREYIQVLRLLESFALEEVSAAVEDALRLGAVSFDAVRHLLLCRIQRRPPRLDLENWPHLPLANVRTTQASDYMALLLANNDTETACATEVMP
jgi:transposase